MAGGFKGVVIAEEAVVVMVMVAMGVLLLLWLWMYRWQQRHRMEPKQWPLLGSAVELLSHFDDLHDWMLSYFQKGLTSFRVVLPGITYTYTIDPANVEYILKTNFNNFPKGELYRETFKSLLGDGIFNTDGEAWRQQRKTASFEFASRVLRDYSTVSFREYSVVLAQILATACRSQQPIEMQNLFMRFTLDGICKVGLGVEVGTLTPALPAVPFATHLDNANEAVTFRFVDPLWRLKQRLNVGYEAVLAYSVRVVDDFTYSVVRTRRQELHVSTSQGKAMKADLLSRFIMLSDDVVQGMTDKTLRDVVLNFIIAGRDTTATTLSWFVYLLANNPHVADKLYHELLLLDEERDQEGPDQERDQEGPDQERDQEGPDQERDQEGPDQERDQEGPDQERDQEGPDQERDQEGQEEQQEGERMKQFAGRLSYEVLAKLQYLHAALTETMRLYPAVPQNAKGILADDVLPDGTELKKGGLVYYASYAQGRMTHIWGADACQFKPERFLKDGKFVPENPFKFTAFQAGPRICLGKDSAYLQMKMAMALLCRFFKFQLVPGQQVKYRMMATLMMDKGGVQVLLTKR